jgi:NAD(P)-dependent dehydrogenase (short-subunit alcohol dehydrogenase family)
LTDYHKARASALSDHYPGNARKLFDLAGQTAIITGAAGGIGRAIAEGLVSLGVSVVLADMHDGLHEIERTIVQQGHSCIALKVDLRDQSDRIALVNEAIRTFGHVDILVNCAGITQAAASEKYPDEDWDRTLNTNLTAVFHLCKLVAKDMIPRRSGVIINVSSINAVLGFPNNPAYQASKGGLLQLTRALATDWAKYNIRVNNICPGYILTSMTKVSYDNPASRGSRASRTMLNRWGSPEELIGPVIFLASQASSYITGSDLFVDGGFAKSGLTEALDQFNRGA